MSLFRTTTDDTPNPGEDISDWLVRQWLANEHADLGAGHYRLAYPVESEFESGCGVLAGKGPSDPLLAHAPQSGLNGASTCVCSEVLDDAICFQGDRFALKDLTLAGPRYIDGNGNPSLLSGSIGVLVSKGDRKGLGTGKGDIRRVTFTTFDTAIQFGAEPNEHNNDETVIEDCLASKCNTFARFLNSQAMGTTVRDYIGHGGVGTHFAFRGGGKFKLVDATVHGGVLVRLEHGNPPNRRTGPNNQSIVIEDLQVDANHKGRLVLVEVDEDDAETPEDESGDCWAHVVIRGGHISGKTASLGTVGEKVRVTVDGLTAASPVRVRERIEDINGRPAYAEYFLPVYPPKGDTGGRVKFVVLGRPDLGSGPWEVVE